MNAMTGKTEDHQVSRLAKKVFFSRYVELVRMLPCKLNIPAAYGENKERCIPYQVGAGHPLLYSSVKGIKVGKWLLVTRDLVNS